MIENYAKQKFIVFAATRVNFFGEKHCIQIQHKHIMTPQAKIKQIKIHII